MAVDIARTYDFEEILRRLGVGGQDAQSLTGTSGQSTSSESYSPYDGGTQQNADKGNTWEFPDWGTQIPNPNDNTGWTPNDPYNQAPQPPSTTQTKTPQTCPEGYEWEDGGADFPMGRCKVKGTRWEDQCWRDPTSGQVYCNGEGPKASTGGQTQTSTPAPSGGGSSAGSRAPQTNYSFDLNALLNRYDPQYGDLLGRISSMKDPYDPSTVEGLVGMRKVQSERQKLEQQKLLQAQRSSIGRGLQGDTQQDIRSIAAGADQAAASDILSIRENAIKANYAAQVQRVDDEIRALNSRVNLALGLAQTDSARQSVQLSYAAQMAQLDAARQNLLSEQQAMLDRLKLQLLFS